MVMEDEEPRVPTEGAREQGVSLRRDQVPQEGNKGWGPSENFKGMKGGDGGRGFYGHGGEQHRTGHARFGGGGKDRGGKQHHGAYQHSRDGGSYQHKYEPDYQNYNSSFHRGGGSYTYQGERGGYEGYYDHVKNAASGYNQNPNYRQTPPRHHDRSNYCPPARTGTGGRPPTAQDTDLRGLSHREKKQALQGIVCRHYLAGSCTKGTYCRFRHPVDPNDFSSPSLSQNGSLPRGGEGPLMINERRARFDGFHGPPLPPEERTRYLQSRCHRELGRGRTNGASGGGAPSGSEAEVEDSEKMASLVKQLAVRVQNLRGGGSKKNGAPPPEPPTQDQLQEKEQAEPVLEPSFYSTSTGGLLGGNGKKMQTVDSQQKDVGESVLLGDLKDLLRDLIAAKNQNLSQGEQGAAVGSSSATSA